MTPLVDVEIVRRAATVAAGLPAEADQVEEAGPGAWQAEVAGTPVMVVQVDNDAAALGVVVLELRRAGPAVPRRPAVAAFDDGRVLPLAVASTYGAVWERFKAAWRRGIRPERVLAALAVRYADFADVDTNQVLIAELADLADHIDGARARALGIRPMQFAAEPPTWTVWSYGLARSGIRPYRLDLLCWRITLDPARAEIVVVDHRTDVVSAFYSPGRR
jgi:hypothetical protein